MARLQELFQRFGRDESGQGLVEYVLIIALVAVGLILAMTLFRNTIGRTFDKVSNELNNAPSTQYNSGS